MRIKRFLSVRKIVALAFSLLLMSQSMSVYASDLDALVGSTEESAVVTESPAATTTEGTSSSSVYKDDGSDALLDALSGTQNGKGIEIDCTIHCIYEPCMLSIDSVAYRCNRCYYSFRFNLYWNTASKTVSVSYV